MSTAVPGSAVGRRPGGVPHRDGGCRRWEQTRHPRGMAEPGAALRIRKEFVTELTPLLEYSDGLVAARSDSGDRKVLVKDSLSSSMVVPPSGVFEWHVNPSARPVAGPGERWTFRCQLPGGASVEREVQVTAVSASGWSAPARLTEVFCYGSCSRMPPNRSHRSSVCFSALVQNRSTFSSGLRANQTP